ncbi:hypothetical protein Tco_1075154 [Tanacetum coccineum]
MKYASICADNGYKFIPSAFSTFHEFDKDALDTLSRVSIVDELVQHFPAMYVGLGGGKMEVSLKEFSGFVERISKKKDEKRSQNDKTGHGMEKRGKEKDKTKPKV